MTRAKYIMIGGFLGAGKTTAVSRLAAKVSASGTRVGLITNDQGHDLVDTAMLRARGFATEEIPGGCFCCRFDSLMEAAERLTAGTKPEVFIAEPVGSCTDLVATVTYPLRRIYGEQFTVAPLSVLVDPVRALRMLELEAGGRFSPKVAYIYRKQLEEADFIVINKCDSVERSRVEKLRTALAGLFPPARIFEVSARSGFGLDEWFAAVLDSSQQAGVAMGIDYDTYAEGEALLGWLNATVGVSSPAEFDGNRLVQELAQEIQSDLVGRGAGIAHLKMTLDAGDALGGLAVVNLVRNDFVPELSQEIDGLMRRGQLMINLRAEADPGVLREAVEAALRVTNEKGAPRLTLEHLEHFQPGRPNPTHRVTEVG